MQFFIILLLSITIFIKCIINVYDGIIIPFTWEKEKGVVVNIQTTGASTYQKFENFILDLADIIDGNVLAKKHTSSNKLEVVEFITKEEKKYQFISNENYLFNFEINDKVNIYYNEELKKVKIDSFYRTFFVPFINLLIIITLFLFGIKIYRKDKIEKLNKKTKKGKK